MTRVKKHNSKAKVRDLFGHSWDVSTRCQSPHPVTRQGGPCDHLQLRNANIAKRMPFRVPYDITCKVDNECYVPMVLKQSFSSMYITWMEHRMYL